ncbi:MAG TPA: LpqB family beta-propeller domain-containing protein, partial [Streptosporangiaceae bacterium]|nr:LpqB family beta-propeller domain-containing protein [Streptosporangiaceae bacterium]
MASSVRGVWRMCVLAAALALLAGCVGMPSNGAIQQFSASPQSSAPEGDLVGVVPSGPQPGENPSQIVQGFLTASASYPSYAVAQEYLVSSAVKTWNPSFAVTVFSNLIVPNWVPAPKAGRNSPQAMVNVSGAIQASFNGSGQYYVSAQSQDTPAGAYPFYLEKVNGQWRITDPPSYRMLPSSAFPLFYKAQDLYFFADPLDTVLVPDSVFVPLGTTDAQLLTNLVSALTQDPKTPWLSGATDTELPSGTKVQQVTIDGSTVVVNLVGKVAKASTRQLSLFAAQLVWTLTGSPASAPSNIQSVELELNGQSWTPRSAPCPEGPRPGPQQTQAAYQCFNPYPSSPASFHYVDRGQSWARCGSETLGQQALIGQVVPVVGRGASFTTPSCDASGSVHEAYAALPPAQPPSLPAVSMAAVSPDGKYLAIVTAAKGDVYVGSLSGQAASFPNAPRLPGGGVTSLSWDRNNDLWVVQNGNVEMLPSTGKSAVSVAFGGTVSDLSVAPDGVRIALVAQLAGAPSSGIYL